MTSLSNGIICSHPSSPISFLASVHCPQLLAFYSTSPLLLPVSRCHHPRAACMRWVPFWCLACRAVSILSSMPWSSGLSWLVPCRHPHIPLHTTWKAQKRLSSGMKFRYALEELLIIRKRPFFWINKNSQIVIARCPFRVENQEDAGKCQQCEMTHLGFQITHHLVG